MSGAVLEVRACPRSSRQGAERTGDMSVKVRVRSAPVDGKANKEIMEVLSDALGIPKRCFSFKTGESSKTKLVEVEGLDNAALKEVLEKCFA